jgi:hypothetical protein
MAKSKKTITEVLREMESRGREARMIAAQRSLAEAQHRLADEMELARLQLEKQDSKLKKVGKKAELAERLLKRAFPRGHPPEHFTLKDIEQKLKDYYEEYGVKSPLKPDTISRALKRRRK